MQLRWKSIKLSLMICITITLLTSLAGQSTFVNTYPVPHGTYLQTLNDVIVSADNHYFALYSLYGMANEMPWVSDKALCIDSTGAVEWTLGFPENGEFGSFSWFPGMYEHNGALLKMNFYSGTISVTHYYNDGSESVTSGDTLPFVHTWPGVSFQYDTEHRVYISKQTGHNTFYLTCANPEGDTLWTNVLPELFEDCGRGVRMDENHLMFSGFDMPDIYLIITDNEGNTEQTISYPQNTSGISYFNLFSLGYGQVYIVYKVNDNLLQIDSYENNEFNPVLTLTDNVNSSTGNGIMENGAIVFSDSTSIRKVNFAGSEIWHLDLPQQWINSYYNTENIKLSKTPDNCYLYSKIIDNSVGVLKCTSDGVPVSENTVPIPQMSLKAYPNPFRDNLTLSFELKEPQPIETKVYNVKGQLVKSINILNGKAGMNAVVWDGKDVQGRAVSNGLYFIQVQTRDWSQVLKCLCLRR